MPLWCRLRLTWSTFRFRSRDACMTKLGIMTDENTTSQQTQPTEAATEAAAETATDTDAQQQDQGAQSAAESAAPVDFEPLTATYERLRHSTDPAELSEIRPSAVGLTDADQAEFSRATAAFGGCGQGNPHTPVARRVFLATPCRSRTYWSNSPKTPNRPCVKPWPPTGTTRIGWSAV